MNLTINKANYKGVDGSSLSDFRCDQIVDLYKYVSSHPKMDYVSMQNATTNEGLFKSNSVMRTFCPLLAKLGFVTYGDSSDFTFTEDGEVFAKILIAIQDCKSIENRTTKDEEVLARLQQLKVDTIRLGLLNMHNKPELEYHNLWIVMDLLEKMDYLVWNEFFYAIYLIKEKRKSVEETIQSIYDNRKRSVIYKAYNEKKEPVADTQWNYLKTLLEEANLLSNNDTGSLLNNEGIEFIKQLKYGE